MPPRLPLRIAGLICFTLIGIALVSADRPPQGSFQASSSETPTWTPGGSTETRVPSATQPSVTPTQLLATPTPQPATPRPSITPEPLPPPGEIGSTDGIITWGIMMVTLILAVLLWHRPDWARRRPANNQTGRP